MSGVLPPVPHDNLSVFCFVSLAFTSDIADQVRALVVAFHMIPIGAPARTSLGYPDPAYVIFPLFCLPLCI